MPAEPRAWLYDGIGCPDCQAHRSRTCDAHRTECACDGCDGCGIWIADYDKDEYVPCADCPPHANVYWSLDLAIPEGAPHAHAAD
jgi:hypothetical protein